MPKSQKMSALAMENRCGICDTKLTLYPKDYRECPHCHQNVCRQCWTGAWASKNFSGDNCTHLAENDGLQPVAYARPERSLNWDWPRLVMIGLGAALAIGLLFLLLNWLVF